MIFTRKTSVPTGSECKESNLNSVINKRMSKIMIGKTIRDDVTYQNSDVLNEE